MKFILSLVLATSVAIASPSSDCSALEAKIPTCAVTCVNSQAAKLCTPGDLECGCAPANLDKIIAGSTDCVATACEGAGPVFPPLRTWCQCVEGGDTTTTSTTHSKTSTKSTSTTSIAHSKTSTKSTSTGIGASTSTSTTLSKTPTSSSVVPTKPSTFSASPSKSSISTTTFQPVTFTSIIVTTTAHSITSCTSNVTYCSIGSLTTDTLSITTTWCPESETQVLPTPSEGTTSANVPVYPTQSAGTGAPSYVPSGFTVKPLPPTFTGGSPITQQSCGLVAGIVVAIAAVAWL